MSRPRYRIYPSILDKYQKFLDSDLVAEEFWNKDAEGDYKLSPEEMSVQLEQELIDSINRVAKEPSEAADKGTAFNEVVDCILERQDTIRHDMLISSCKSFKGVENKPNIAVAFNDWEFFYDASLCKSIANYFNGCVPQYTCSAILSTIYGDVELYGHIDYVAPGKVYDLKTTKNYTFGNYEKYWQRHLYPFCLIESGDAKEITEFEFTVVKWRERKNEPICGDLYKEVYTYSHQASRKALTAICESFIEWLEHNRGRITDKKIFGGEKDETHCA